MGRSVGLPNSVPRRSWNSPPGDPATGAVHVVRQERSRQDRVGACRVVGVDGVEECTSELVCALCCGRCVETVETCDGGGAYRHELSPVGETCVFQYLSRPLTG